jgi:thiol-disulfide isomerase/thioredoxin
LIFNFAYATNLVILQKLFTKTMRKNGLILFASFLFLSNGTVSQIVKLGQWRATIQRSGYELPFGLEIIPKTAGKFGVLALNGTEKLALDDAYFEKDSLHIPMSMFDSELVVKVSDSQMNGSWKKRRNGIWVSVLPFKAEFGYDYRFTKNKTASTQNISGKWATYFYKPNGDSTFAVGILSQTNTKLSGTFLTSTGDYRFLAGDVQGDSLFLSCYDGSHVYMFRAAVSKDGQIRGGLWAGVLGFQKFRMVRDEKAALPDPTKITYLKEGYDAIDFSFKTPQGQAVSLKDERFKNKVVVLQIMGTWCPNCMDETRFLAPWYKKNNKRGVEIVGLSFEHTLDMAISGPKIERTSKRFGVEYPVVLAGTDNADASKSLPMLNRIAGYPTTIFIDRKGKVREIHTGFSGPGTGKYYDEFIEDFNRLITKLLSE